MSRRLPLILALLLAVAACDSGTGATTTTDGGSNTTTTTVSDVTTTTVARETTTTTSAAATTTVPDLSGVENISEEVRTQLEELIGVAQEIRGLPFLEPPNITVVSDEELERRVREDIVEDPEDFAADEALYKTLGLLNQDADFEQILLDLYGEQVAGFYDGETGEIVVPSREDGFTIVQQGTIVHEFVHALTDQHFSFHDTFDTMITEDRLDQAAAYQALIEGDASWAEVLWVQTLSQEQIGEFLAESLEFDTEALDSAPRFLVESLLFPYDSGLAFIQSIYQDSNSWDMVNDAYSTMPDLPGSTEQIISPEDYRRDLPMEVAIPDVDVDGYELQRTSVWGEHGFRLILNQGEGTETVAEAADGWGGDSYHQWYDGENAALLLVYQGDTPEDVTELEDALLSFATEDFPEEHFAWVDQLDGNLYFIAADDPEVGEQLRAAVGLDDT
ncbi:MAG: hypothetical protein ACLFWH_13795 [Actinomycetota bacterium]